MPKEWYLMDTNAYFSGHENENFNDYAAEGFAELLAVSPEAENVLINGQKKKVIIQNTMTENIKLISIRYMLSHIGDSKEGYYVDFKDNKWLVLAVPDNNKMYEKSVIQRCNHNLKWIDSSDNLITKPSIVSVQTLYTTGVKDEKVIEIPNGMIGIQLPYDEDAKKLDREASFVFNKTKYKITSYNEVEYEGLLVLICTEIGTSHLDDEINQIANRWKEENGKKIDRLPWLDDQQPPIEPEAPTIPEVGITYTITAQMPYADVPDNEIWLDDPPAIYTIHKFIDGVETSGKFTFEITNTSIVTITETTDNTVSIIANDFVGKENIKLIATDVDTGEMTIEKEITICGR